MAATNEADLPALIGRLRAWLGSEAGIAARRIEGILPLYPEEAEFVERAVLARRAEFSTGRWCARAALTAIGVAPQPLPVGPLRAPLWPQGTIGSITHDGDICLAVALPVCSQAGVGIDLLGADAEVSGELMAWIAHPQESERTESLRLRFSAKEATIKAISLSVGRFIDMPEIWLGWKDDRFRATYPGLAGSVYGWHAQVGSWLLTAALYEPERGCGLN